MKKQADKNLQPREFEPGSQVKLRQGKKKVKGKWEYPCTGPYRVIERGKSPTVYVILDENGERKTVNMAQLAPWEAKFLEPIMTRPVAATD